MKTIREHLFNGEKFNHIKADDMAMRIRDYAKEAEEIDVENGRAIFRFINLSLNFLATECSSEDFSFIGLFKLVCCETCDDQFLTEYKTVFDVLMEEPAEKDRALYNMYQSYGAVCGNMPKEAFAIIFNATEKYCSLNDLMFEAEQIMEYHDEWTKENTGGFDQKDVSTADKVHQDLIIATRTLRCFNLYRNRLAEEDLIEAFEQIESINSSDLKSELKEMLKDFDDHKNVYVAVEELIK